METNVSGMLFLTLFFILLSCLSWREGVVTEKNKMDDATLTVHFPGICGQIIYFDYCKKLFDGDIGNYNFLRLLVH